MLAKMTVHKSVWDVKFLYVVYVNWGTFSGFVYRALNYCCINNVRKGTSISLFNKATVLQNLMAVLD